MFDVYDPSTLGGVTAVVVFAGIFGCLALGRRIGGRVAARQDPAGGAGTGSLETAVFALLGLLIAFTFSGALSRIDVRRAQIVDEANAVGTAYLRIDLLPAAAQPRLRETLRQYTDSRIATYAKLPDLAAARVELAHSQQLQAQLWAQAVAAVHSPESRPGTDLLFMPPLNQMFDLATVRLAATLMHPPLIVYIMLVGFAFVAALLAGYHSAGEKAPALIHQVAFSATVAFTVYVILDMEYPRTGWVRIDAVDQVLKSARNGMK